MLPFLTFVLTVALQQPIDATALTITLERDSFTVRVARWTLRTRKASEMNSFVMAHRKEIDPSKAYIFADNKTSFKELEPVLDLMKKQNWLKWQLRPTPNAPPQPPKVPTRSV